MCAHSRRIHLEAARLSLDLANWTPGDGKLLLLVQIHMFMRGCCGQNQVPGNVCGSESAWGIVNAAEHAISDSEGTADADLARRSRGFFRGPHGSKQSGGTRIASIMY